MNRNVTLLTSCLLIIVMIFTSCAAPSKDLMKGVESKIDNGIPKPMDKNLNQAVLNFTWNMFKVSSQNEGNIMVSPASAYFALAMTLNGADKETKAAMQQALSAQNIATDAFNIGLRDWMNSLTSNKNLVKLSIANSVWLRDDFEADEAFLQQNADYFSAAVQSLDFSKKSSINTINKWVKDSTNDTIDKVVDKMSANAVMYLINAIYFKGNWKEQFSANDTYKMDFNAPNGKVDAKFMNRTGDIEHLNANGITGVKLPYLDEKFAFVGLLPKEGQSPRDLINNLTASDLSALLNSGVIEVIELSLPKFESSYEDSLNDELSKLGMEIAFDPSSADFSLMKKSRDKELYISEVKHETFIRVDEKGTEAAAVTSVEMVESAPAIELPKVVFDRPFVYGIIDVTTGIPLFMGIMENPTTK